MMRATVRLTAVITLVAVAAAPGLAVAEEADERISQGERAFARREYDAALGAFSAAYEDSGIPALLYNIAMCQWELDRPVEAVNTFRRYLELDRASLSEGDVEEIERILGELRPRHGDLVIEISADGAVVTVDQQGVGTSPLGRPIAVAAGEHRISAAAAGMETAVATTSVEAGGAETITIELEPVPTEEPAEDVPIEDVDPIGPRSGPARPLGWWFWTATGLTAAATVGFSITGGLALGAHGDYEESGHLDIDAYDSGQTLGVTTDALIGVAAVSAAAAVVSLVLHYTVFAGASHDASPGSAAALTGPWGGVSW